MTWFLVLALAAAAYGFKLLGLVVLGSRRLPTPLDRCLALVPAALLTALIVKDTFSTGHDLVVDARTAGVAAAVAATWRRLPIIVVILLGAVVTAVVRRVAAAD